MIVKPSNETLISFNNKQEAKNSAESLYKDVNRCSDIARRRGNYTIYFADRYSAEVATVILWTEEDGTPRRELRLHDGRKKALYKPFVCAEKTHHTPTRHRR